MPNGTTAIRAVIGLFVGAILLCGWIIMRGGNDTPQVTRTTTPDLTEPAPQAPAPAALAQPVAPVETRDAVAADQVQNAIQLALAPKQDLPKADSVASIAAQALADLQNVQATTTPDPTAEEALNQSVLTQILKFRGQDPDAKPSLADAVSQAMSTSAMDDYTMALIEAARSEGIEVDEGAFQTEDGSVDTRVLLSQIVAQAAQAQGSEQPKPTARPQAIGGEGVELYTVQTASGTEMHQFYTVQSGDSLGFIAQKFYGDAGMYTTIWQANRQLLSSPDQIRKGQRLRIPSL